ncbi:Protein broad-minded [Oopsacas minuta]|uniref:Protein broad-minded n=1 Tax=Oopsacas minuta TaxID=111878 RepID=A0AAV7JZD2_9METZ|nr:Protein broad-minded [Oopsacas minuta]
MPYISSNYLKELVNKFDTSNSPDVRREALQAIIQFSPSEILSCPDWPTLHMLVTRSLRDQDAFISNNSFGILLRLFSTSNLTAIKEAYLILVEHLLETPYYSQQVRHGIDVCAMENAGLIQKFHLLTLFIHWLPSYWFRFNNAFMTEIIDKTINLLMLCIDHESLVSFSNSHSISPMHILSIIDHKAEWFQKLIHAEYSRTFIVQKLEKHPAFLCTIVEYILAYLRLFQHNAAILEEDIGELDYFYNETSLSYLFFIALLNIIQNFIIFECRLIIFPQTFDGEYFKDKNDAAIHFITIILENLYNENNSIEKQLDPYYITLNALMKILQKGNKLFLDGKILTSLMRSINSKSGSVVSFYQANSHLSYVYDVIQNLTESDTGRKHFFNHEHTHLADLVAQTKNLLQSIPITVLPSTIRGILAPVINLFSTPEGIIHEDTYKIIQLLTGLLKKPAFIQNSSNKYELLHIMSNVMATPKGIVCLKQNNILDDCIEILFLNTDVNLNSYKNSSIRYGYILSQVSNFSFSTNPLQSTSLLDYLTDTLNKQLNRTNEPLLHQQASLIAPLNRSLHKAMYNMAKVFVNYATLIEIVDRKSIEENVTTNIAQFLLDHVLVKSNERINDICNFEEKHVIALALFNLMLSSLDNFLLLEDQFGITTILLSLQNSTVVINDVQVFDQLWYERNRSLLKVGLLGGPKEKMHPHNSLHCYEEIDKNKFQTFKEFPIPTSYGYFKERIPWLPDESKEFPIAQQELQIWFTKLLSSNQNIVILKTTNALLQHIMCQAYGGVFPKNTVTFDSNIKLMTSSSEHIASKLIVQYGCNLRLLKDEESDCKQLLLLIANMKGILINQQYTLQNNLLNTLQSDTYCYDWFIGIMFILTRGDVHTAFTLLSSFSTQLSSCYIWLNRMHKSKILPQDLVVTGRNWGITNILHNLELIVKAELQCIYAGLHISGVSLGTICCIWLQQCFLNYLDFEEICSYILTVLILGIDYQLYFIVSILKHLQTVILSSTQENNLMYCLLENPITGYRLTDWIEYMRELEERWRNSVNMTLPDK